MGGASLRARRGAAAEFGCSLRNVSCRAQMSILLSPLLLLLAALVAPAISATTYRPDWNRLRGLARGRVEVSAPFPNLSTVPQPCCLSSWNTVRFGLMNTRIPESSSFPPAWSGNQIIPFISQPQDEQHPLGESEASSLRPGTLNPCSAPGLALPWVSGHPVPSFPGYNFSKTAP